MAMCQHTVWLVRQVFIQNELFFAELTRDSQSPTKNNELVLDPIFPRSCDMPIGICKQSICKAIRGGWSHYDAVILHNQALCKVLWLLLVN